MDPLLPAELSAELGRILKSDRFSQTTRQSQLLRFIVTETALGRGDSLKEYLIGTEVFQKPGSFDPRIDSIVRVEAARLRTKLKIYYETEGKHDPLVIKLPPRGYRPVWEPRPAETLAPPEPSRRKAPRMRWRVWVGVLTLTVLCGSIVLWRIAGTGSSPGRNLAGGVTIQSVAVASFNGERENPGTEYLGEGITESVIAALSQPRQLRVVALARAMAPALARRQEIDAIVSGSVRESMGRVRVTAHIVRPSNGEYLWSATFERSQGDIFPLQDEVAMAVRRFLLPGAGGAVPGPNVKNVRPEARKAYLTGRHYLRQRSEKGLEKAIAHFEQAIALDPGYAQAYEGLASAHSVVGRVASGGRGPDWPRVKWAATQALARDGKLAEAATRLAGVLAFYEWEWAGAESLFRRAISYDPTNADAHHNYAHYLIARSRLDEAMREMRLAQELDPVSPIVTAHVGLVYYMMRQYDRAIEECGKALEMDPGFYRGNWEMARVYVQKSMPERAIRELETARAGFVHHNEVEAWLAACHARLGRRAEAERLLQQGNLAAFDRSLLYSALRERDQTLNWLTKACDERSIWVIDLNVDPMYDWLRSDPRFRELVKRVHL